MKKRILAAICILTLLFSCTAIACAGSGDGDGSGNGQNKNIALTLKSSVPDDGADKVATGVIIQLNFNKNICNVKVLENNRKCFHLTSHSGKVVPVTLTFPDDQVQRSYKRQVFIQARGGLQPNTEYRLAVDSTLMAKNGNSIDNAHTVEFTTGSRASGTEPKILKTLGDNTQVFNSALKETKASVPKSQDQLLDEGNDKGLSVHTISQIAAAVLLVVILIFTLTAFRRRRK